MKTFAFDFKNNQILAFKTRAHAYSLGNGKVIGSTEEDLAKTPISMDQMVSLYNALTPAAPIKKFENKQSGLKRLIALANVKAIEAKEQEQEKEMVEKAPEKAAKAVKKAKEATEAAGRKGRTSAFAGKVYVAAPGVTENPRREGTGGFKSMTIILAHPKGIAYEDFIAAGGRRVDLAWDIAHGSVVEA